MSSDNLAKLHVTEEPLSRPTMVANNAGVRESIVSATAIPDVIVRKFIRPRDQWRSQRGHESSVTKLTMLPAYQMIVGIGPDAVPLLLRELEQQVDYWFWALQAITEEDPVPAEARGNWRVMAEAWLTWGKNRGYQW